VDPQIKTFHLCIRTLAVVASAANRAAQRSDSAGSPKSDLDFSTIFRHPKRRLASGKHIKSYGKSLFFMGKSTINGDFQ